MADSRKRRNPKSFEAHSQPKKRFDFSNLSGFRFLIPSKAAGSMIGKGGEVIKRLRTQFSCRIIVPDSEGPERMVIMDGEVDAIISAWNDALPNIQEAINAKDCDYKNSGNKQIDDETEIDIRLLVHESQAGALIGKGGERIRNFIDNHKMTIIKLYPTLCPNSTDRIVRLVSTPDRLLECLRGMLKLLECQVVKGPKRDYDPNNYDEMIAPDYGGFMSKDSRYPQRKSGGFHQNDIFDDHMPRQTMFDRVSQNDDASSYNMHYGGSNARNSTNVPVDLFDGVLRMGGNSDLQNYTSRVVMPIHLVSAVIGTDGHRLSDIKRDSGALIQLDEMRFSEREEMFLIRGTADQIYKAQCLMQLCARKYGDVIGPYGF